MAIAFAVLFVAVCFTATVQELFIAASASAAMAFVLNAVRAVLTTVSHVEIFIVNNFLHIGTMLAVGFFVVLANLRATVMLAGIAAKPSLTEADARVALRLERVSSIGGMLVFCVPLAFLLLSILALPGKYVLDVSVSGSEMGTVSVAAAVIPFIFLISPFGSWLLPRKFRDQMDQAGHVENWCTALGFFNVSGWSHDESNRGLMEYPTVLTYNIGKRSETLPMMRAELGLRPFVPSSDDIGM